MQLKEAIQQLLFILIPALLFSLINTFGPQTKS